jgi:hypothetical protein
MTAAEQHFRVPEDLIQPTEASPSLRRYDDIVLTQIFFL